MVWTGGRYLSVIRWYCRCTIWYVGQCTSLLPGQPKSSASTWSGGCFLVRYLPVALLTPRSPVRWGSWTLD